MDPDAAITLMFISLGGFLLLWAVWLVRNHELIWTIFVDWRVRRARTWLLRYDYAYQQRYISQEVIRQRELADRAGDHDRADRIDRESVARDLGINLLPSKFL